MHKISAMAKALKNKTADKGGNFIAHRLMLKPNLDIARGERADKQRHQIIRRRESRQNDKAMGY